MEILTAEQMQAADREAIDVLGIPGLVLMENAGRLVAETIVEELPPELRRRIVVLAGRGNNGGDGFVVARHLAGTGHEAEVYLVGARQEQLRGDAAAMAQAWTGPGGRLLEIPDIKAWEMLGPPLGPGDLVVDALFGTGLTRPLKGLAARVVLDVDASGAPIVAVDLPSGLSASATAPLGPHLHADLTVTFARPKPAQLLPPSEQICGDVHVVDIGIPARAILAAEPDLYWVTAAEAAMLVPLRDAEDHKGRYGHLLVVAGSTGKAGAAALTGAGALRSGAGLTTVAAPAPVRPEVAAHAPELMTVPLPASRAGELAGGAHEAALAIEGRFEALAVGPGLGQARSTQTEIRRLVQRTPLPTVLDADGLNAFGGRRATSLARRRAPALVLTPHPGEAARLLDAATEEIQEDRLAAARRIAELTDAVCVLKGHRTLVAEPGGRTFVNSTGNPGMATGGMGDLLTGLIGGFLAQGLDATDAAVLGVFVHGFAADLALEEGETEASLTASAVAARLSLAFARLAAAMDDAAPGLERLA